jgi:hypothetical protein
MWKPSVNAIAKIISLPEEVSSNFEIKTLNEINV